MIQTKINQVHSDLRACAENQNREKLPKNMNSSASVHSQERNIYKFILSNKWLLKSSFFFLSFRAISLNKGILLVDGMLYIPPVNKRADRLIFDSSRSTSGEASFASGSNP